MKKYFKFLSLVTIIAIVASVSVIAPLTANAGSLTNIQISLSSYDKSASGADVNVNMTAQAILATELSGTAQDSIMITFNEYAGGEENQFNVGAVVFGDVTVTCAGDANVMDDAAVSVNDGGGFAPDTIEITMGDATSVDTCAAASVLKIVIANNRIRTPYTASTIPPVAPGGYRIKLETFAAPYNAEDIEDSGTSALFINEVGANQVLIYGTVDPVLTLSVLPTACDLGVLTKDNFRTCAYTVAVGTNADLGYGAYIKSDGDLNDNVSLAVIQKESVGNPGNGPGTTNAIDNDTLLAETEYGMGVYSATETLDIYPAYRTPGWGDCDTIEASLTYDVPVEDINSTTAQRFAYSNDPVDGSTAGVTELCHVARISGDQPSGNFTQTVTITVVGNF